MDYAHLHVHSYYSLLDGYSSRAARYALLNYRIAWLKAHYPKDFAETCKNS